MKHTLLLAMLGVLLVRGGGRAFWSANAEKASETMRSHRMFEEGIALECKLMAAAESSEKTKVLLSCFSSSWL